MIVSASRRTDIPAYYFEWFVRRLQDRHVLVRNPFNTHQVSRIRLSPDVVDGFVFWSKNPQPMLDYLPQLDEYPYYVQFTLTGYGPEIEPQLPPLQTRLSTFAHLANAVGPERVIWRYDPIFLNGKYAVSHHLRTFEHLAQALSNRTRICNISFMDLYACTKRNMKPFHPSEVSAPQKVELVRSLGRIGRAFGIEVRVCAEQLDLDACGVAAASCIDASILERQLGCTLSVGKDRNQRPACRCAQSIDIGMYDSCLHGCRYCYANHSDALVQKAPALHDPASPLLLGQLESDDRVTEREVRSEKQMGKQLSLFSESAG